MYLQDLCEGLSTNVLVCDMQPTYEDGFRIIMPRVIDFLTNRTGNITFLYNGNGLTNDTETDVVEMFRNWGMEFSESKASIQLIEKEYGFFREWMDADIPHRIIIKVIRAMAERKAWDSRDIPLERVLSDKEYALLLDRLECRERITWGNDIPPIFFPYQPAVSYLKRLSPFYLIGGFEDQCLAEIILLCNAFNIRYTMVERLIY